MRVITNHEEAMTTSYVRTVNYSDASEKTLFGLIDHLATWAQDKCSESSVIANFARNTILRLLSNISRGQVSFEFQGQTWTFGNPYVLHGVDGPHRLLVAHVKILRADVWSRLLFHPDFGFADAYLLGDVEVDSLEAIFRVYILNRHDMNEMATSISPFWRVCRYISNTRLANKLNMSPSNISAHYDLPTEVFSAFLSRDLTYSCAVFDEEAGNETGDLVSMRPIAPPEGSPDGLPDDLERAQLTKLRMVADRARLRPGCRVLEIGCGWGSFAMLAAREYGAEVDTITISLEQLHDVRRRFEHAGLADLITVHYLDYRKLPPSFHHAFDSVVSIGVMEHVGIEFMTGWFQVMSWAMKPENSFKVFTMSTVPDTRWKLYSTEVDFVRRYIYPGGQLSSVATLVNNIQEAGLNINSIEDIGPHYARTLREWGYRWKRNFESHIKPAMKEHYPELSEFDLEIFRKKFEYYFAYSEAGFAMRSISDHLFTLTREANILI